MAAAAAREAVAVDPTVASIEGLTPEQEAAAKEAAKEAAAAAKAAKAAGETLENQESAAKEAAEASVQTAGLSPGEENGLPQNQFDNLLEEVAAAAARETAATQAAANTSARLGEEAAAAVNEQSVQTLDGIKLDNFKDLIPNEDDQIGEDNIKSLKKALEEYNVEFQTGDVGSNDAKAIREAVENAITKLKAVQEALKPIVKDESSPEKFKNRKRDIDITIIELELKQELDELSKNDEKDQHGGASEAETHVPITMCDKILTHLLQKMADIADMTERLRLLSIFLNETFCNKMNTLPPDKQKIFIGKVCTRLNKYFEEHYRTRDIVEEKTLTDAVFSQSAEQKELVKQIKKQHARIQMNTYKEETRQQLTKEIEEILRTSHERQSQAAAELAALKTESMALDSVAPTETTTLIEIEQLKQQIAVEEKKLTANQRNVLEKNKLEEKSQERKAAENEAIISQDQLKKKLITQLKVLEDIQKIEASEYKQQVDIVSNSHTVAEDVFEGTDQPPPTPRINLNSGFGEAQSTSLEDALKKDIGSTLEHHPEQFFEFFKSEFDRSCEHINSVMPNGSSVMPNGSSVETPKQPTVISDFLAFLTGLRREMTEISPSKSVDTKQSKGVDEPKATQSANPSPELVKMFQLMKMDDQYNYDEYNDMSAEEKYMNSLNVMHKIFVNLIIYVKLVFNKFHNSYMIKNLLNVSKNEIPQNDIKDKLKIKSTIQKALEFFLNNNIAFADSDKELLDKYKEEITLFIDKNDKIGIKYQISTKLLPQLKLKDTIDFLFTFTSMFFERMKRIGPFLNQYTLQDYRSEILYLIQLFNSLVNIVIRISDHTVFLDTYIEQPIIRKNTIGFFKKYSISDVVTYVKIRDNDSEPNSQMNHFNPRYLYYSEIPQDETEEKAGIKKNVPLSLLYMNDPSVKINKTFNARENTFSLNTEQLFQSPEVAESKTEVLTGELKGEWNGEPVNKEGDNMDVKSVNSERVKQELSQEFLNRTAESKTVKQERKKLTNDEISAAIEVALVTAIDTAKNKESKKSQIIEAAMTAAKKSVKDAGLSLSKVQMKPLLDQVSKDATLVTQVATLVSIGDSISKIRKNSKFQDVDQVFLVRIITDLKTKSGGASAAAAKSSDTDAESSAAAAVPSTDLVVKWDMHKSYGPFDTVFYNTKNPDFGKNMEHIIESLKTQDVFLIGYGASGSGKTSTLIYDKIGHDDGAIVYMLKQLREQNPETYNTGTLDIHEMFFDFDYPGITGHIATPKSITKINELQFDYEEGGRNTFTVTVADVAKQKKNFTGEASKYKPELFHSSGEFDLGEEKEKEFITSKTNDDDEDDEPKQKDTNEDDKMKLSNVLKTFIDAKRKVAATTNNNQSSRSHVNATFTFSSGGKDRKLHIGDFAGVENKFDYKWETEDDALGGYMEFIKAVVKDVGSSRWERGKAPGADQVREKLLKNPPDIKTINEILGDFSRDNLFPTSFYELSKILSSEATSYAEKQVIDNTRKFHSSDSDLNGFKHEKENRGEFANHGTFGEETRPGKFAGNNRYAYNFETISESTHTNWVSIMNYLQTVFSEGGNQPIAASKITDALQYAQKFSTSHDKELSEIAKITEQNERGKKKTLQAIEENIFDTNMQIENTRKQIENIKCGIAKFFHNKNKQIDIETFFDRTQKKTFVRCYFINLDETDKKKLGSDYLYTSTDKDMLETIKQSYRSHYLKAKSEQTTKHCGSHELLIYKQGLVETYKYNTIFVERLRAILAHYNNLPSKGRLVGSSINIDGINESDFSPRHFINRISRGDNGEFIRDSRIMGAIEFSRQTGGGKSFAMYNNKSHKKGFIDGYSDAVDKTIEILNNSLTSQETKIRTKLTEFATSLINYYDIENPAKQIENKEKSIEEGGELRKKLDDETAKLSIEEQNYQSKLERDILPFQQQIQAKNKNVEENQKIASIILNRAIQMHYESTKRTFEGVFINKSLEIMRKQMVSVLKEKNKSTEKGDFDLIPRLDGKCINLYGNNLTMDSFSEHEHSESSRQERKEFDAFNLIHQTLAPEGAQEAVFSYFTKNVKYAVCLVLNNSFEERGLSVNNPPKIPVIPLDRCLFEYQRFKSRSDWSKQQQANFTATPEENKQRREENKQRREEISRNLIFKKYVLSVKRSEGSGETTPSLICDGLKEKISESIGFYGYDYDKIVNENINIGLVTETYHYCLACYICCQSYSKSIPQSSIGSIKKAYDCMYAYADNESLRQNEQEKIKVLTCFKTFIDEISVMNSTSVVGTIDFTDQLSKYNLNYFSCSTNERDLPKSNGVFYDDLYKFLNITNIKRYKRSKSQDIQESYVYGSRFDSKNFFYHSAIKEQKIALMQLITDEAKRLKGTPPKESEYHYGTAFKNVLTTHLKALTERFPLEARPSKGGNRNSRKYRTRLRRRTHKKKTGRTTTPQSAGKKSKSLVPTLKHSRKLHSKVLKGKRKWRKSKNKRNNNIVHKQRIQIVKK